MELLLDDEGDDDGELEGAMRCGEAGNNSVICVKNSLVVSVDDMDDGGEDESKNSELNDGG